MPIHRMPLRFPSWGIASPGNALRYISALHRVRRLVREHDISEIHCGRCLPEGLLALAMRRTHGTPYHCYIHGEELNSMSASRELTVLATRVYRHATSLIVNSENTARMLADRMPQMHDRVHIVHPGVDTSHFAPPQDRRSLRDGLGWRGRKVLLTVGRLQKRKGHDRMIEALPTVVQSVPTVLYAIAGAGEEFNRLHQLAIDHGVQNHVQFLGPLQDRALLHAYQACDAFALPNREVDGDIEGFGMVLLEAQACGKPVITGNSGGTPETMLNGRTGLLVDAGDARALAHAAILLTNHADFRHQLGHAARKWAVERFDWRIAADRAMRALNVTPARAELREAA
jgi:phosphatidylinositol alpha-1,6-mannosyltransferase